MTDIERRRAWVADMYPGPKWKSKVKKMSDAQVTAIYLREQNKPKKDQESDDGDDAPTPF
jgi:hypothetical protein